MLVSQENWHRKIKKVEYSKSTPCSGSDFSPRKLSAALYPINEFEHGNEKASGITIVNQVGINDVAGCRNKIPNA